MPTPEAADDGARPAEDGDRPAEDSGSAENGGPGGNGNADNGTNHNGTNHNGTNDNGTNDNGDSGRGSHDVPAQRQAADLAASRYDLFLSVAGDLDRVDTAYDAELVVSTMLGAAYAIADGNRGAVLAETTQGLREHLAHRHTRPAELLKAVLATHDTGGHTGPATLADPPGWLEQLGTVRPTGAHAFGDRGGTQVTYLASFAYAEATAGGPEHVVAAVVDHGLGHVRDLFVAAPAGALLAQLEAAAATDPTMRMEEVDPGELRATVERSLDATDGLAELPEARSLTSDRALAAQRLRLLPQPEEMLTVKDFLVAPEAARVVKSDEESRDFALKLISGFAASDPLRWNPDTVKEFLLDWLPARALLDRADIELVPRVLSAWVRWAGRMSGLSARDVAQNVAAVATNRAEFAQRARSGSHRSEAATAMIELLKDGVDLDDEQAVADWLTDYNLRGDNQAE
jgi:hypothetical protein